MNVAKRDLISLFSMANANWRDLDAGDLDDQQFVAMCWAKAVNELLLKAPVLEFPTRLIEIPED